MSPSGKYVLVNGEFVKGELDRTEVYLWGDFQPAQDEFSASRVNRLANVGSPTAFLRTTT